MSDASNGRGWPGCLEAALAYEQARGTTEDLLRRLEAAVEACNIADGEVALHWGHVGRLCRINAHLAQALAIASPAAPSNEASQ